MPIKTLHLTNAYHPSSGGIRTFYREMLATANAERRLMRLVVPAASASIEEVGDYGRIYYVRAPKSPWVDSRYRLMLPHTFLLPQGEVASILRAEQPDLVEVCDKYSLCYLSGMLRRGWLRGVSRPTLIGLTCERLDDNVAASLSSSAWATRFAQSYVGRVYAGQFDAHLANSEYTARELRDHMVVKHRRDVHVIPMGVRVDDLGPWRRDETLRTNLLNRVGGAAQTLLLYAGRLAVEKNLPLLIETMTRLDERHALIVAGDGPALPALRAAADRAGRGRILFYGHVGDRNRLAALYASCDVFVHPNPREPFGIGPLEAMASGAPLVAPDAGGLVSYANASNAWLTSPSADDFAAAVRDAATPGPNRDAKRARAQETAASYAWPRVTRTIFDLYEELHARRREHAGHACDGDDAAALLAR